MGHFPSGLKRGRFPSGLKQSRFPPAAEDLRRLAARHPDVKANCFDVKFRDYRAPSGQDAQPFVEGESTSAGQIVEFSRAHGSDRRVFFQFWVGMSNMPTPTLDTSD